MRICMWTHFWSKDLRAKPNFWLAFFFFSCQEKTTAKKEREKEEKSGPKHYKKRFPAFHIAHFLKQNIEVRIFGKSLWDKALFFSVFFFLFSFFRFALFSNTVQFLYFYLFLFFVFVCLFIFLNNSVFSYKWFSQENIIMCQNYMTLFGKLYHLDLGDWTTSK